MSPRRLGTAALCIGCAAAFLFSTLSSRGRRVQWTPAPTHLPERREFRSVSAVGDDVQSNLTLTLLRPLLRESNAVVFSYSDSQHADFVRNWATSLSDAGVRGVVVAALDDAILESLHQWGIAGFRANTSLIPEDFAHAPNAPRLHLVPRVKIECILKCLRLGVEVLFSDADVVWFRNPFPYLSAFPRADMFVSTDDPQWPADRSGLDKRRGTRSACTGLMHFRLSALPFVERWRRWPRQVHTGVLYDQPSFMQQCAEGAPPEGFQALPGGPGYFPAWQGRVLVGTLPPWLFMNGHTYFIQQLHQHPAFDVKPFAVHASFVSFGSSGKRHRFRAAQLWADSSEYYDPPEGLLVYDSRVPPAMLAGFRAEESVRSGFLTSPDILGRHMALVHHQLRQLRVAMAAAEATKRVLVLPDLWCGYDRAFSPHSGTFPGTNFTLPFRCPLDLVLDVGRLDRHCRWLGRPSLREHSVLQNPRAPPLAARSATTLSAADLAASGGVNDVGLRNAAEERKAIQILRLGHDVLEQWEGFRDAARQHAFEHATRGLVTNWCCVHIPKRPGHIWYDMWFDKIPHWDIVGREWKTAWHPRAGDK
eukprot:TRINITY_DN39499_c0_g1_i1.p1 TRINITY_DN39499_c0_g1~~TRINITY_DN39499_c0_g1_i1.p1  ORF type:complete len:591 (+),score=140.72 TRINITY_DN39499_c0_g1_i1:53-1825(+)